MTTYFCSFKNHWHTLIKKQLTLVGKRVIKLKQISCH